MKDIELYKKWGEVFESTRDKSKSKEKEWEKFLWQRHLKSCTQLEIDNEELRITCPYCEWEWFITGDAMLPLPLTCGCGTELIDKKGDDCKDVSINIKKCHSNV